MKMMLVQPYAIITVVAPADKSEDRMTVTFPTLKIFPMMVGRSMPLHIYSSLSSIVFKISDDTLYLTKEIFLVGGSAHTKQALVVMVYELVAIFGDLYLSFSQFTYILQME